jgi:dipeptidyl aminopeptidase
MPSNNAPYTDNPITPHPTTEMRTAGLVDPLVTRPRVYYGEGAFDPPSSDDDDDNEEGGFAQRRSVDDLGDDTESVSLLSANKVGPAPLSPGRAERGNMSPRLSPVVKKVGYYLGDDFLATKTSLQHVTSVRLLAIILISLVSLSAIIGIIAGFMYQGTAYYHAAGQKHITMDHIFNGTFYAYQPSVNWVAEGIPEFVSMSKSDLF